MNQLTEYLLKDAELIANQLNPADFADKTILISGATGMVGTYFVAALINLIKNNKLNTRLIAIAHSAPVEYYQELLRLVKAEFISGDLTDQNFCESLPEADYIIHAAGYAQPGKFLQDQTRTLKINTLSTFYLLDKLKTDGKFLFVGSSEIYSGLPKGPFKESDIGSVSTDHPRYCYIEGKRAGEAICASYRSKGVKAKVARLSLAYGPGTRPGDQRAMTSFIEKALNNGKIELLDKGEAVRTYCYVADAVAVMLKILFAGTELVYNVGGVSSVTIAELAKQIGVNLNVPVNFPKSAVGLPGSPQNVSVDMNKYEKQFNKINYLNFKDGLNKTISWVKLLLNAK
ncbi:MAG: hypothetical protein A3J93_01175 [Candidatus Magasanikbacteria bacterium RIFOXYC2_FULL_42_28]|uniref:NAD-dependent epimerase/dehydratase domain-containing protein n=1 Tax=Candidatus Magasanikbacteria bacterium RIFOXYC2_FULL_42_28 TaxID=1798704 RepID=A0A1F6NXY9_9BACT|nr:MAG: hypothetical protein A3J93_01175 [Candidatus Magasanikbacteria bacterium RIFOXYC2_FULL_42_28]